MKKIDQSKRDAQGELKAQPLKLDDLVEYQDGSIVSRTLIDTEAGTITLFAFDRDQGLSEHTTPYNALVYLLDGEAEITISGKPLHVRKGEMIIMPADISHAVRAVKRFKRILTMVRS